MRPGQTIDEAPGLIGIKAELNGGPHSFNYHQNTGSQDEVRSLWSPRTGAMNMRDVVAVVIAAVVLGLVFFATLRLEQPRSKVTVEQIR